MDRLAMLSVDALAEQKAHPREMDSKVLGTAEADLCRIEGTVSWWGCNGLPECEGRYSVDADLAAGNRLRGAVPGLIAEIRRLREVILDPERCEVESAILAEDKRKAEQERAMRNVPRVW